MQSLNVLSGALVVGIAGGSGAGKTTIGLAAIRALGDRRVTYLPHDAYYRDLSHLSPEDRDRVNFDHPSALETDLLIKHISDLRAGYKVERPIYDFSTHCREKGTESVAPGEIVVVDGLFVLGEPGLRDLFHLRVFVDAGPGVRFARRLQRDLSQRGRTEEGVKAQYLATVQPMHEQFVEPTKQYADLVLSGEAPLVSTVACLARAIGSLTGEVASARL